MYILIGADIVPTKSNVDLFTNRDAKALVGTELVELLDGASYRIFNLETPLADVERPIVKQGPNLIAPTAAVAGYNALKTDLLTLANNHIMDQDVQGLHSTVAALDGAGIGHVGTGDSLDEASAPYFFEFAGRRVGVYACTEHEFSIAGEQTPGANPYDPLWSFDHVAALKQEADYVIVLYHGGKEEYRYPSPMLQKVCRRFVDKGADLVICQHSHCIGCREDYKKGTIVYGQGNFLFDECDNEYWQTSLLVRLDDRFEVSHVPLVKNGKGVRLADGAAANAILKGFGERSSEIREAGFVESRYRGYAEGCLANYLGALSGNKAVTQKILNRLSAGAYYPRLYRRRYGAPQKRGIINYIECESHRELLLQALRESDGQL